MSSFWGPSQAESEIGSYNVYRIAPDYKIVTVVADDFEKPNGIAFSPDEKILYISDTGATHNPEGPHHIRAFDMVNGKSLENSRVFAEIAPAVPDGFRLDVDGNVWTSAGDGVHCYAPEGKLLGKNFQEGLGKLLWKFLGSSWKIFQEVLGKFLEMFFKIVILITCLKQ